MFKILATILIAGLVGFCTPKAQAQNLPSNYLGGVLNYTNVGSTQTYNYSFTATTSGADYIGFAFRQDPGFWTFTAPKVSVSGSSTNLLLNGNLQYGGTVSSYGIQAPADWGVWYQNGTYPAAAGFWSTGQWYDGAVGSYDGIYQAIGVTAGTTYSISFNLSGTDASSNPSIEVGTYAGACASGTNIFTCTPGTSAGFTALATPQQTQGTGGAPTAVSTSTTNTTSTMIVGSNQVTVTTPTITTTWSDGSTTTSTGTATQSVVSSSAFTGVHFGAAQVADTQWNVSACMYTSTCQIYSTRPGGTYETGSWLAIASTQYITFIPNTGSDSSTNPWTMILVNANGTFSTLGTGRVLVEGQDSTGNIYLFFTNSNLNGTLLSGNLGLTGQGVTFSGTASPSPTQTNTLSGGMSASPLTAGQTGGTGGTVAPTVVSTSNSVITTTTTSGSTVSTYSQPVTITTWSDGSTTTTNNGSATLISTTTTGSGGSITTSQQSDVNNFNSTVINGNGIYIRQSGNNDIINIQQIGAQNLISGVNTQFAAIQNGNNTINIKQGNGNGSKNEINMSVIGGSNTINATQSYDTAGISAGSNYQLINVNGFSNSVTTTQTNDGGTVGQFLEAVVNGNYNTVGITQSNNGQKQMFASITGNNNTINTTQNGTGSHYLSVTETGNGNSATVNQSGSTANSASITLVNSGAPASVNLTQTGGQSYSITQTCVTTCGTVTVRQGN